MTRTTPNDAARHARSSQPACLPATALALAVVIAPFAAIGQAEAACTPTTSSASPLINTPVTCTGATANQNGTSGYGVPEDKGNTINVQSGASVTGTDIGIRLTGFGSFTDADTVNNFNFGSISGASGIRGSSGIVNNNAGATISGSAGDGISILSQGVATNSGTISGTGRGVSVQNGTVTNMSGGTISGGIIGVTIQDDGLQTGGNPAVFNAGTITGGTNGVRFFGSHLAELTNSGLISATGAAGAGASFAGSAIVTNSGTIEATGSNGSGIFTAGSNVTVDASGNTGSISGAKFGIQAVNGLIVSNGSGTISGGNTGIQAITANVTNTGGTITGGAVGISATAAATIVNSGTISGGVNGIQGEGIVTVNNAGNIFGATNAAIASDGTVVVTANTGTIAGGAFGINAGTVDVTNSNAGIISGSTAINATGGATVTNLAGARILGDAFGIQAVSNGTTAYLIGNWNNLARIVFESFAGLGLKASGTGLSSAEFLRPGRIAQVGIDAGRPILDSISGLMGYVSFFENFIQIVVLLFAWVIVLLAFFILAIQLFVTLIEFKLTTLAGFVLIPFGLFGKTAFAAERVLGNVISSGVKVMVLAVIVGIGSTLFSQFTAGSSGAQIGIEDAMALVLAALALLGLGIFGPGIANGIVSGGPQLGAGAAAGTGLAAGGVVLAGAGLAAGSAGALAGAARGAATLAGGASGAFRASGLPGGAAAGASATTSPLRRAAASAGSSSASTDGAVAGEADAAQPAGSSSSADTQSRWAWRVKRMQTVRRGASAATNAGRSADQAGGGASVDLSEGKQ